MRRTRLHIHDRKGVILWGLICGAVAFTFLLTMVAVAYFLTAFIFQRFNISPPPVISQMINSALGIFFIMAILTAISSSFRSRQMTQQWGLFGPIINAIQQIAKGDFSVRLGDEIRDHGLVGELAKSVNNMALELDQMEQMRQEFISNVSHEIQSPLTSMRGFAQALGDDHLSPEDRQRYLSIIVTESTRLSKLTENLLELTSLDSEHVKFEPQHYRLDKQVRNLILACEPQWAGKQIDMEVALDEVTIAADEDLLSQVWINLLYNSIKFTPERGHVCVELHAHYGLVAFKIVDSGIGISEADQAHIFERFYKADQSRQRAKGGSGLGLSIAKKIVDMHKGTIGVESQPSAGATFTVRLPTAK